MDYGENKFNYSPLQKSTYTRFALYKVKWVLFKLVFGYVKVLPCSCLPVVSWPLIRPFKWGTAWSSISRDIRNTSSQTFGYPSLLNKVGLFWYFWLWLVVILMPPEVTFVQYLIWKVSIMVKTYLVGRSVAAWIVSTRLCWKVVIYCIKLPLINLKGTLLYMMAKYTFIQTNGYTCSCFYKVSLRSLKNAWRFLKLKSTLL